MTPLEHAVAEPLASLGPDERRLWQAVAPTLARVGMLEPRYAYALELLISSAAIYFGLLSQYRSGLNRGLPVDASDAEHELGEWRRLVLRLCADFGLRAAPTDGAPDAITVRAEERWLVGVFGVPEGWAPAARSPRLPGGISTAAGRVT